MKLARKLGRSDIFKGAALALIILLIPGLIAQAIKPQFSGMHKKHGPLLTLNGIKFEQPERYKVVPQNNENAIFMFDRKYKEGLFVAVTPNASDEEQTANELIKTSVSKFFPSTSHPYSWRPSPEPKKFSRFEVGGGASMGFNGNLLILTQYHLLHFGGKSIYIGSVSESSTGAEAAELFQTTNGGESMGSCNAFVDIVSSITGEQFDENNSPCVLVGLAPSN